MLNLIISHESSDAGGDESWKTKMKNVSPNCKLAHAHRDEDKFEMETSVLQMHEMKGGNTH